MHHQQPRKLSWFYTSGLSRQVHYLQLNQEVAFTNLDGGFCRGTVQATVIQKEQEAVVHAVCTHCQRLHMDPGQALLCP